VLLWRKRIVGYKRSAPSVRRMPLPKMCREDVVTTSTPSLKLTRSLVPHRTTNTMTQSHSRSLMTMAKRLRGQQDSQANRGLGISVVRMTMISEMLFVLILAFHWGLEGPSAVVAWTQPGAITPLLSRSPILSAKRTAGFAPTLAQALSSDDEEFADFESSLDQDSTNPLSMKVEATVPDERSNGATATIRKAVATKRPPTGTGSTPSFSSSNWQAELEEFLDPFTSVARKQILFSSLLTANAEIRTAALTALREGKVRRAGTVDAQSGFIEFSPQIASCFLDGVRVL
jgi:hypothetical protein